jgi:hypothetical protein
MTKYIRFALFILFFKNELQANLVIVSKVTVTQVYESCTYSGDGGGGDTTTNTSNICFFSTMVTAELIRLSF